MAERKKDTLDFLCNSIPDITRLRLTSGEWEELKVVLEYAEVS